MKQRFVRAAGWKTFPTKGFDNTSVYGRTFLSGIHKKPRCASRVNASKNLDIQTLIH